MLAVGVLMTCPVQPSDELPEDAGVGAAAADAGAAQCARHHARCQDRALHPGANVHLLFL